MNQAEARARDVRRFVGRTLPVLFERRLGDGRWSALTPDNVRVDGAAARDLCDLVADVRITAVAGDRLSGALVAHA